MMNPRISLFAEHEREDLRIKIGNPLIGLIKHMDFEALAAGIDVGACAKAVTAWELAQKSSYLRIPNTAHF